MCHICGCSETDYLENPWRFRYPLGKYQPVKSLKKVLAHCSAEVLKIFNMSE